MITATPTENLTGITIEGEHQDFYELVDSIYRITSNADGMLEDYDDEFWTVKNRLLGLCYDIRHAYMGDRDVCLVDNEFDDELKKVHALIVPDKNLHYSVNVLFPEALFVALSAQELYLPAYKYYGARAFKKQKEGGEFSHFAFPYFYYIKDKANIDQLCAAVIEAFAEVIGDEEMEKLKIGQCDWYGYKFMNYAGQYVMKCTIEYIKTSVDKRPNKLKNIAKRLLTKPSGYMSMKNDMEYGAAHYGCSIHELHDPKLEDQYPEEIVW